jgi:hypothetical protein
MRYTRLALVMALVLGAVGATGAQDIDKADPTWVYLQAAKSTSLTVTITRNGVELTKLTFLPGTLLAASDGKPRTNCCDFQGNFELRAKPAAEATPGPAPPT